MLPKYQITLTENEREKLESLTRKKTTPTRKILRAKVFLLCDAGPDGPALKIADVAARLGVTNRTVGHLKRRCIQEGIDVALERRTNNKPSKCLVFDQNFEAGILALASSQPPAGYQRWTVRLLADKAVEHSLASSVSHMTIHRILKKFHINLYSLQVNKSHRKVDRQRTAMTQQKLIAQKAPPTQPVYASPSMEP